MAKGFASARTAFEEIEARKNSGGGGGFFFKLSDSGDKATVRFLDDDVDWAWVHELPKTEGTKYGKTEICRDQDPETGQRAGEACPGCDKDYRRKMSGVVRLIWRDGPVYEQIDDGKGGKKTNYDKVIDTADVVAKWTVGKVILEELDGKAATYKSLSSRDFVVTRRGTGLDTTYDIEPLVDENGDPIKEAMSENDKKLAEEAPEVSFKPPSFEDWGHGKGARSESPPPTADPSPFRKRAEAA